MLQDDADTAKPLLPIRGAPQAGPLLTARDIRQQLGLLAPSRGQEKGEKEKVEGESKSEASSSCSPSREVRRSVVTDANFAQQAQEGVKSVQKAGKKARLARLLMARDVQLLREKPIEVSLERIMKWTAVGSEEFRPPSDYAKLTSALQSVLEWIVKHLRSHREALSFVARTIKPWEDIVLHSKKEHENEASDVDAEQESFALECVAVDPHVFGPMSLSWMTHTKGSIQDHSGRLDVLEETARIIRSRIDKIAYDALGRKHPMDGRYQEEFDLLCKRDTDEKYTLADGSYRKKSYMESRRPSDQEKFYTTDGSHRRTSLDGGRFSSETVESSTRRMSVTENEEKAFSRTESGEQSPRETPDSASTWPMRPSPDWATQQRSSFLQPPGTETGVGEESEAQPRPTSPLSARSRFRTVAKMTAMMNSRRSGMQRLSQQPRASQVEGSQTLGTTLQRLSQSQRPPRLDLNFEGPADDMVKDERQSDPIPAAPRVEDIAMQYVTRPEMMEVQEATDNLKGTVSKQWEHFETQINSTVRRVDELERLTTQRFTEMKDHAREAAAAIASCDKKLFADDGRGDSRSRASSDSPIDRRASGTPWLRVPGSASVRGSVISTPSSDSSPRDDKDKDALNSLKERVSALEILVQSVPADIARLEQTISGILPTGSQQSADDALSAAESVRLEARDVAREQAELIAGRAEAAMAALEQRLMRMLGSNNVWASFPKSEGGARRLAGYKKGQPSHGESVRSSSPLSVDTTPRCGTPSGKTGLPSCPQGGPKHRRAIVQSAEAMMVGLNNASGDAAGDYTPSPRASMFKGKRKKHVTKATSVLMPVSVEGKVNTDMHVRMGGSVADAADGASRGESPARTPSDPEQVSAEHSPEDSVNQDSDLPLSPVRAVRVSVSHRPSLVQDDGSARKNSHKRGSVPRMSALNFRSPDSPSD